jgi:Ni/Co efflux regulator RcnB
MKTMLAAAVALSLLGGTAASAQSYGGYGYQNGYDQNRYEQNRYNRSDRSDRHDRDGYQSRGYDRDGYGRRDGYAQSRRWARGERLPSSYRSSRYSVDYRRHNLRAPPRGYGWQRVDENYVLASLLTGLIVQVIANR